MNLFQRLKNAKITEIKSQITNSNFQFPNKSQYPIAKTIVINYNFIWNLKIVILCISLSGRSIAQVRTLCGILPG
jgi:hypothetical protein